ncbi:hypothetical protein [Parafilimonas sp.]|uniref:hypothetical protein n=1 Tax=Parafilimonas sp. TaxID=1969739 RepID=UPI0039E572AE
MIKTFTLIVTLLFSVSLFSQNDSLLKIEGIIRDNSNNPVPNAVIKFKPDSSKTYIAAFAFSNTSGGYSIQIKKMDSGYIEVSSVGYITRIKKIIFQDNNEAEINFVLATSENFLPSVSVTYAPKIIQKKDTIIFNAESYKKDNQQSVEDLLKNMPGFQVNEDGKLNFNGKAIDKILIDNDDLFGSDYVPLTKNVTPDKIQHVEVIDNYKDNSDLSQQLTNGNEQVINLKFDKKISKAGSIDAGVPLKRYESKANLIVLIPKTKLITIANANSTGKLTSSEANIPALNTNDQSNTENIPSLTKTSIADIYVPNGLNPSWAHFNHSAYVSANAQFNLTKSFVLKAIVQSGGNRYAQSENSTQTFYDSSNPLIINEDNNVYKKNYFNRFQLNGRYTSGTKFQVSNTADVYNNKDTDNTNGFLLQTPSDQNLFNKLFYLKNELKATYVMNSKSLITATDNINYGNQLQQYFFSPLLADSIFQVADQFNSLFQDETSKIFNHDANIKYSRGINKNSFNVELGNKSSRQNFYSYMQATDSTNNKVNLSADFNNNIKYTTRELYAAVSYSSLLSNKLSYIVSLKANSAKLIFDSALNKTYFNKLYMLPSITIKYEFSNNAGASFSYAANENLPRINQLYNGYIFTGLLHLEKGSGALKPGLNHGFNLNYHFGDLVNKGLLLFSGAIYQINQLPYVNNLNNRQMYSFLQNEFYNAGISNTFLALYTFIQKIMPSVKSQVTFNISVNTAKTTTGYNDILQTNKLRGSALKFEYRSVFDKQFNFTFSGRYTLNHQKNLLTGVSSNTHQLSATQTFDYTILKSLHLNSSVSYLSVSGNLNKEENIILLNAGALFQVIPKKLSVRVSANNLLNKTYFVSNSFNSFYSYANRFEILKRFATINVQYKF